jgi:HK97 family phage prohead protease
MYEKRFFTQDLSVEGREIVGWLSYNSVSSSIKNENGKWFKETIKPYAFRDSLKEKDIPVCLGHDQNDVLASKAMGNLAIEEKENGISIRFRVPNNALGDEVINLIDSRKIAGVSPSFYVQDETWNDNKSFRKIHKAELIELSLVDQPAYLASCAALQARKHKENKIKSYPGIYYEPKTEIKMFV